MSKTFIQKGLRGFTLIELMVVIAIIGLLSTVIAAPISQAMKKGRDSKKISDLHSIQIAANLYAQDHGGNYPLKIDDLIPDYLSSMPAGYLSTTIPRDRYLYVAYTQTAAGNTFGVGYHLGAKLEAGNAALIDDRDCSGISGAGVTDPCIDSTLASGMTSNSWLASDPGNPKATSNTTDFGSGSDTSTTQCTGSVATCIYDITN